MKIPIAETLKNGLDILKANPIIFAPIFIEVALNFCIGSLVNAMDIPQFESMAMVMNFLPLIITIFMLSTLPGCFLDSMVITMVFNAKRKRRLSLAKVAKFVAYNYITLLIAGIFFWAAVVSGFMLMVIPGIFLVVRLIFYKCAVLLDEGGIVSSLGKSWKATEGNWWRIAALMLIFGAMFVGVSGIDIMLPQSLLFVSDLLILLFIKPWFLSSFTMAYLRLRRKK